MEKFVIPYAHSIDDACKMIGIKKSMMYELVAKGEIKAKKIGARTVIPDESLREYLAGLPDAELTYFKARP